MRRAAGQGADASNSTHITAVRRLLRQLPLYVRARLKTRILEPRCTTRLACAVNVSSPSNEKRCPQREQAALIKRHHAVRLRRILRRIFACHERVCRRRGSRQRGRQRSIVIVNVGQRCARRARRGQQAAALGSPRHYSADVGLPGPHHKRACERRREPLHAFAKSAVRRRATHRQRFAAAAARALGRQGDAARRRRRSGASRLRRLPGPRM